jgi:hypothetical protein
MAKRTGNSSVNSSIRQQTKSNEEGLTQLLVVQQQSLGHLSTIQTLMENTANIKDDERLKIEQESLSVQKKQLIVLEESDSDRKQTQEAIQKLMDGMKTFKSPLERMRDGVKGFAGKFSGENIKKNFLESTNIMGINNKKIEKEKFIKEQKALGSTATSEQLSKNFEGAYSAKKESSKVEQKIQKLKQDTGGKFTDEELAKSSRGNAALFAKKAALTEEYSQFDIGAKLKGGGKAPMVSPSASEVGKTPTSIFASAGENEEQQLENSKLMADQTSILQKIEENTRKGNTGSVSKDTPTTETKGGGLLDGITGMLGEGLMTTFKTLFSPKNLLKALGKVFVIGTIVGALFSGITDAFDEFMQSGSIGKAIIAGLAGIVDFLTFGLFDKEKIKEVIGDFATWTNDHLIQPFVKFITGIKDSFMAMIQNIGIPEIKFTIPIIKKEVAIGPFYPFKSDGASAASPTAAKPTSADAVSGASKQNADDAAATSSTGGNNNAVVNTAVTTNNKTSQIIRSPIRNQESSVNSYLRSRYAT